VVSRDLEVVPHGLDVISVVNNHVLDRIKVDGQGVLVVESDASHFTYGRISILIGSGMEMRYQYKEEFVEESGRTNVVIAAYTTAQARLKLYSYLEQLGPRALYEVWFPLAWPRGIHD
jgi:hypothetical protein